MFLKQKKPQQEVNPLSKLKYSPLYIKINEVNTDNIEEIMITSQKLPSAFSFYKKDKTLIIKKETLKSVEDIINAKLLVEYTVTYRGQARSGSQRKSYVFNTLPAKIEFKDLFTKKIELDWRHPPTLLFNNRLLPPAVSFESIEAGKIKINVGEKEYLINTNEEKIIFENMLEAQITQHTLSPIPQGKTLTEDDIQVKTKSLGSKKFGTKISVQNQGIVSELKIQD